MTDQQFIQMKFEASEYRRLLTICREQVTHEMERADNAEETVESLLTMLQCMVEAFSPDIYRMAAAPFGKDRAADLAHQQARDLIKRIESEMRQPPSPVVKVVK
jgi:hypothetical protein